MPDVGSGAAVAAQAAVVPAFVWGKGELVSICFGIAFMFVGAGINRKAVNTEKLMAYLANGIAFGPLLMIVADPANQYMEWVRLDLFKVAMTEARVTLWWAAFMAGVYMLRTLLRPSP